MIGFAQLRHIGRDAACGAIEREYEARYIYISWALRVPTKPIHPKSPWYNLLVP